jgi:hypothetical protein
MFNICLHLLMCIRRKHLELPEDVLNNCSSCALTYRHKICYRSKSNHNGFKLNVSERISSFLTFVYYFNNQFLDIINYHNS